MTSRFGVRLVGMPSKACPTPFQHAGNVQIATFHHWTPSIPASESGALLGPAGCPSHDDARPVKSAIAKAVEEFVNIREPLTCRISIAQGEVACDALGYRSR